MIMSAKGFHRPRITHVVSLASDCKMLYFLPVSNPSTHDTYEKTIHLITVIHYFYLRNTSGF